VKRLYENKNPALHLSPSVYANLADNKKNNFICSPTEQLFPVLYY